MRNPGSHCFLLLCCLLHCLLICLALPIKVGVIVDQSSLVGNMTLITINIAVSDFHAAHPNSTTTLVLDVRDSGGDTVTAATAAEDLMQTAKVDVIIGPQSSGEAAFVASLATNAKVPLLSFSANSPSLYPARTPYFIRTSPSAAAQCRPIAAVVAAFGWTQAVLIHEDTPALAALAPCLTDSLAAAGVRVAYRSAVAVSATDDRISAELYKLMAAVSARVYIVHAGVPLALRLFAAAAKAGMMAEGYAWIATDAVADLNGAPVLNSMQGAIVVRPLIPRSTRIEELERRWRREFVGAHPDGDEVAGPSAYDLWAYDTVWAVAAATAGAPPVAAIRDAIIGVKFDGMAGRFEIAGGERQAAAIEVVNVVGKEARGIGVWTAEGGLVRGMEAGAKTGMGAVIWPGESTVRPRGWEVPSSGRRMRIAVPGAADPGFSSFLKVLRDPATNRTAASGFVIEVFEAAVAALPYALPYEYVAFLAADGHSAGDYNRLVHEVSLRKYDAGVGDITITSNRSNYVDFTLPYTISDVSMVVPVKAEHGSTAWIFLKPLTTDLWLMSGAFFVFTGAVVWVLEHRINEEFRGPPAHQIGTLFFFSFSTLVFAHREKVMSNLSRIVMIVWLFVVLILTSSYTASLTSMLTVQQLNPSVSGIAELIKNGQYVGYLEDSFVRGLLLRMGFNESKLRPYRSPIQYAQALQKGSHRGGVAAIVDEVPYLKVFLKHYCDNYTMTGPTYKTGGFGFVFPQGSPLAADISRAILNITDGGQMAKIEKKWFGNLATCLREPNSITSNSLDLSSFWGLFLITGTASALSLCFCLISFLYQQRNVLRRNGEGSIWRNLVTIGKHFDSKDLSFHTFKSDSKEESQCSSTEITTKEITTYPQEEDIESPRIIYLTTYLEGSRSQSISSEENLETVDDKC